jgi:hypothetical protein
MMKLMKDSSVPITNRFCHPVPWNGNLKMVFKDGTLIVSAMFFLLK